MVPYHKISFEMILKTLLNAKIQIAKENNTKVKYDWCI